MRIAFTPGMYFDVLSLKGQAVISEEAKQTIEAAGMTGVDMPEVQEARMVKGIEIIMD